MSLESPLLHAMFTGAFSEKPLMVLADPLMSTLVRSMFFSDFTGSRRNFSNDQERSYTFFRVSAEVMTAARRRRR
jgi:hypothetical protein